MGFYVRGLKVEERFAQLFEKVEYANQEEDFNSHWDVKVFEKDKWVKFDIKALKKINRWDKTSNESVHWVELKNVFGKLGWLYGEADKFAFELQEYFIVVDKLVLQKFIQDKCKKKEYSDKPEFYKFYRRRERRDIITLVRSLDLMFICDYMIRKEDSKKLKIKLEEYENL